LDDKKTDVKRCFVRTGTEWRCPSKPRLDQLQILRLVAASAVMFFHVGTSLQTDLGVETNYFSLGAYGVDIFFVLSGFIITYSVRPEAGAMYFGIRRIARIVPLYWTLTIGVAIIAAIFPHLLNSTTFSFENLMKSLLFIPYRKENGLVQPMLFLGWTLNYEMFFYVIVTASLLVKPWKSLYPCVLIVVLVILGQLGLFSSVETRFYTDPIVLEFVFGVILCNVWIGQADKFQMYRGLLLSFSATTFLLSLCIDVGQLRPFVQGAAATSLIAAMLPVHLSRDKIVKALVLCGNASYSLYLAHPYIVQASSKLVGKQFGVVAASVTYITAIGVSIAFSVVLYLTLEVRGQRLVLNTWDALLKVWRTSSR
jgi:exopolysaccharide production protein ExoZ